MSGKVKATFFKILKIVGISLSVLLLLVVVAVYSLRFPSVQDYVVGKALNFYKNKVNQPASLSRLYVDFPSNITIEELYLEDTNNDTLIYAGYITVQTDLWALLDNKLHLSEVELDNIVGRVSRPKSDSLYNFQFIIDAFSADKKKKKDTTKSFDFSLGNVLIKNSDLVYNDGYTGIKANTTLEELSVNFSDFDIINKQMIADRVFLKGTKARLNLFEGNTDRVKPQTSSQTDESFNFDAGEVQFSEVDFSLEDDNSKIKLVSNIGNIKVVVDSLDINNNVYTAREIKLDNSFVSFDQFSGKEVTEKSNTEETEPTTIWAGAAKMQVSNTSFRFYDHTDSIAQEGFDPTHFWLQNLSADFTEGYYKNGTADGTVNSLSVVEKNGMTINQLQGKVHYGESEAYARNLIFKTKRSDIKGDLNIAYPSIASIADDPGNLSFDIDLDQSTIHTADILYFQPALKETLAFLKPHERVRFDIAVNGNLNDLTIEKASIKGLSKTRVFLSGSIAGLPDAQRAFYDLNISKLFTTKKDITTLVSDTLVPPSITLPDSILAQLKIKGRMTDFSARGKLNTSLGNIDYDAKLKQNRDSVYAYKGNVKAGKLQLGKLLNNDDLGITNFNLSVDGEGFEPENMNGEVEGKIDNIAYKNYIYKNIEINAIGSDRYYDGSLRIDDENLGFVINGVVNMGDSVPQYNLTVDLDRADLYALNLSPDELKMRAYLKTDLAFSTLKSLSGDIQLDNLVVLKEGTIYQVDTVGINAISTQSTTDIKLRSPVVDADLAGEFDLETLPVVMKKHFDHYLNLSDSTQIDSLQSQSFSFNINFKNPVFLEEVLIPGLEELDPGQIKGKYNSEQWLVDIEVLLNKVKYQGTEIDSFDLQIKSDKSAFNFDARVAQVKQGTFVFKNLLLQSKITGDHIKADFKIKDEQDSSRYHFGGELFKQDSEYVFSFSRDEFVLNYEPWKVNPQNEILFREQHVWINDLKFTNDQQQILLQTKTTEQNDTLLNTSFDRFNLGFLGKFKETEAYVLGGILNGNVKLFTTQKSLGADLTIDNFSFKGDTLGNIKLTASSKQNTTQFDLDIKSGINDFEANGTITQEDVTRLDIEAQIKELNISTIEAFTTSDVSELEGVITGNLKLTGTIDKPDINGKLNFNDTGFRINYTGAKYTIKKETLSFNNEGISFNKFTLQDKKNDELTVDGKIATTNYKQFKFDLKVNGNNFQLLNTTAKESDLVYGNLGVNVKADVTGTLRTPKVTVDLGVADGSNVTYVIPESQVSVQEREGVVRFIDQDLEEDEFFQKDETAEDSLEVFISGIDLRANIDVSRASTFNIVIDPVTNDRLTVSGNADLALKMRPSGDMTLSGRYEISEGAYQLNFYGLVKRRFEIQQGSYLLWSGDPLNARMNVTATYTVRATAGDADVARKIPFIVYLDIGGQLLLPEISFRLAAEEGEAPPSVQSWISSINQQESVLNQQVFSLLVFKTFTSSAFSGGGGGGAAESTARNSVSRILSNQLNRLGQKIKGVELSFDLESYQDPSAGGGSSGRTELELGLSKEFFDNRLIVKVAGDFDVEGGDSRQQQNASSFGGDIRIEYKLTEDGRFRLVGFRQNEYDNLLQGEIAETGVGVIFVRDYNTLKELFKKAEKEEGGSNE